MVESEGIEPSFSPCKGLVLPLDDDPMVGEEGIEPTRCKSHGIYSPAELLSRLLAHNFTQDAPCFSVYLLDLQKFSRDKL